MRFALLIAYDGTDFAGWWRQPGARTVAGVFDQAFARLGEAGANVVGASRTDAGVHAEGQVAHVDTARTWNAQELRRALATHLPADASCREVVPVDDAWDACHAAVGKTYRYTIDHGDVRIHFARVSPGDCHFALTSPNWQRQLPASPVNAIGPASADEEKPATWMAIWFVASIR